MSFKDDSLHRLAVAAANEIHSHRAILWPLQVKRGKLARDLAGVDKLIEESAAKLNTASCRWDMLSALREGGLQATEPKQLELTQRELGYPYQDQESTRVVRLKAIVWAAEVLAVKEDS